MHVFGPRDTYQMTESRRYTPGLATTDGLSAMLDRMGMHHAVIVQASPYGDDHTCLLNALYAMEGRCAGVACFTPNYRPNDRLLTHLDDAGVRAVRVHTLHSSKAAGRSALMEAAALATDLNWHLEIQVGQRQLSQVEEITKRFDGPVVLDHLAHARTTDVSRIAAMPMVHVKLSGLYRHARPEIATDVARALVTALPMRCVWASDWPHTPQHPAEPAERLTPMPFRAVNVGADIDRILGGFSTKIRQSVFCSTPTRLYARQDRVSLWHKES